MATELSPLAERLQRHSHRICSMILNSDLEWIDISIEINAMRQICESEAPDKLELFEGVYVSRFTRLWEQWRRPLLDDAAPWRPNPPDFHPDFGGDDGLAVA